MAEDTKKAKVLTEKERVQAACVALGVPEEEVFYISAAADVVKLCTRTLGTLIHSFKEK